MRYQFYREHKYVCADVNDLERQIAKADFSNPQEVVAIDQAFHSLKVMLQAHAEYENDRLHILLKHKHSKIHEHAEEDHSHQDQKLAEIQGIIDSIAKASTDEEKLTKGYQLYLTYRKFAADNLLHLHEEETTILPELQRLYTDDELKQVEAKTYAVMTSEQMVEMMQVLFPHMNPTDRLAFLSDIQQDQPEKFAAAWQEIAPLLGMEEQAKIARRLDIH